MNNWFSRVRGFFRVRIDASETHKQRARRYRNITHRAVWTGAGLLGLIGLISAGVLDEAPQILKVLVFTCVLLGGAGLAQTRVRFEMRERLINNKIEDRPAIADDPLPDDLREFPKGGYPIWLGTLWAIIIAGLLTLIGVWWPVFFGKPVETPDREPAATSEMLRDRIAFLERELDRRADEAAELRRIIETCISQIPEIERAAPRGPLVGSPPVRRGGVPDRGRAPELPPAASGARLSLSSGLGRGIPKWASRQKEAGA
jgi:hypothetical protein